jgi:hypothetical protein
MCSSHGCHRRVRVYNTRGGFFDQISPLRPVFSGGPGAWELVGRFSYIDLDSGPVKGGKFWRITPVVNWHMSDNVRLEFVYGYGSLNRFDLVAKRNSSRRVCNCNFNATPMNRLLTPFRPWRSSIPTVMRCGGRSSTLHSWE